MKKLLLATETELVVCGQSMRFNGYNASDLAPKVQMALSAKTTLSKYQTLGYVVFEINEKE